MIAASLIAPDEVPAVAAALGQQLQTSGGSLNLIGQEAPVIRLQFGRNHCGTARHIRSHRLFAPAMALLFLMYTVTRGAESILTERDEGTMSHPDDANLSLPSTRRQDIRHVLSGVVQVGLLIVGNSDIVSV